MKSWTPWTLAGCMAMLIFAAPLLAHHGSAGYDRQNSVTLTGTVRSIELINPHTFIYLDVTMKDGTVATWAVEGTSPRVLESATGWTKDTFKPGTPVTVVGYLPRGGVNPGVGTFHTLSEALAYSPHASDLLKTKHVIQAGELRLSSGEVRRFGMGPSF